MHTEAAIAVTAHAFADGAVASVQNGVGNEEAIAPHVARVIRGTTFPAGKILEPGVVQWDVKGDTTFGPFEPSPASRDEIERLAAACTRGGMPTTAVEDARGAQWRKVIFNASTNPIGALTGLTHGRVCERPDLRALVSGLVDEGKAVAAAQGIELDADPEELIDHAASPRSPTATRRRCCRTSRHAGDRGRLAERRHRPLRARARRPDPAQRGHRGPDQGNGGLLGR
jgi:2-dehydropantoate 2-reductase